MWKAKHLSMAGKTTLAKAVIEFIPTYSMISNIWFLKDVSKRFRNYIDNSSREI